MTEREIRIAYNRLCTRAMVGKTYHPESCMDCESPCKYGTRLLRHNGLCRENRETPEMHVTMAGSDRLRRCLKAFNRRNITRR